jgi:protein SCO1/2
MTARIMLAATLCAALTSASPPHRYRMTGLVVAVDHARETVVVSNDSIPGYMDAMTMSFRVREPRELLHLQPGMNINCDLVVTRTSSYISSIHVLEYKSTEAEPVEAGRLSVLDSAMAAAASPDAPLQAGRTVPDFSLIDQNRQTIRFSQFAGQVVAITFIYTRCPLPDYCVRMSNNFRQVQKRFAGRMGRDLVLLSISFDTVTDQPEVLAKYAEGWQANSVGWHFLTGPSADVKRVCAMFGMNYWPDEGLLTHSLHTVVVDRAGTLVANIEGNHFSAEQLGDLLAATMDRGVR